jgi:hypothetical protein
MELLPCFLPDTPAAEAIPAGPSPHPRPYFIFAGRLEVIKGVHEVIEVFRRYTDADLLVAGDGDQAGALSRLAADCPRVRFLGRISFAELNCYYEHAIAAIVPSIGFETFGNVLIEAFRAGVPVIARRLGPFPEIIELAQGGELFSTTRLADALAGDRPDNASFLEDGLVRGSPSKTATICSIPPKMASYRGRYQAGSEHAVPAVTGHLSSMLACRALLLG